MEQRNNKTTKALLIAIAVFVVALIALIVAVALTPSHSIVSHSAQVAEEAEEKALEEAEKEGFYDTDPIEVIPLTQLMGVDLNTALALIGHGAEIDGDPILVPGGLTDVTIILGEESATIDTGMAVAHLYLDKNKTVVQASYRININDLSCATLSFADIVNDAHLIERLLEGAGLDSFEPDPVVAPSKEAYAEFDSSGKTTIRESYEFTGTGTAPLTEAAAASAAKGNPNKLNRSAMQDLKWSVLLDYDYAQAIETNNLAYTVRTVQVSISSAK